MIYPGSPQLLPKVFRSLSKTQFASANADSFSDNELTNRTILEFDNEGHEEKKESEAKAFCLDKWIKHTTDTVTAVAISDTFLAWASQTEEGKYAIFVKKSIDLRNEDITSYLTKGIIQDLDFDDSSNPTRLIGGDFVGCVYVINLDTKDAKTITKLQNKCTPTSITISHKKNGSPLIGIGTLQGELFFIPIEDHKQPNEWATLTPTNNHGSKVVGVHFLAKCSCKSYTSDAADEGVHWPHVHVVVAYKDGLRGILKVVRIELKDGGIIEIPEYKQFLNLNVEFGDVIASSDGGDRFAVACGDQKARVFVKTSYFEDSELVAPKTFSEELKRYLQSLYYSISFQAKDYEFVPSGSTKLGPFICDTWELYWVFDLNAVPLAVSMSGNGKRLAIGQENSEAVVCAVDSGCKIHSFKNTGRVRSVSLNSNGKFLLAGGFDKTVRLLDIEEGFKKMEFKNFKGPPDEIIQSVSMDDQGRFIAVGTLDGHALVYEINRTGETKKAFISRQLVKQIYVVKLSGDGKLFAFGGYNNEVWLVEINPDLVDNPNNDFCFHDGKTGELPSPRFIWGLDIKENKGSYLVAVGSWDHNAYLYSFQKNPLKKQGCLIFPQEDRVFDVAISIDSSFLLVGGRDMKARLYKIPQICSSDHSETILKEHCCHLFEDQDRIYCVAISNNNKYIAYGGICKQVNLYILGQNKGTVSSKLVQKWQHQHTVHRIQFVDDSYLVAISEDGCCVLYCTDENKPVLRLMLEGTGNSVACTAKENGILAVAHGFTVTICGEKFGYGVFDRPSFEVAQTLLSDPVGLKVALDAHPTLTNSFQSRSGMSLLSYAVQKQHSEAVTLLLDSEFTSGLIIHSKRESALTIALRSSNRSMVEKLLFAITSGKIANTEDLFKTGFFSEFGDTLKSNPTKVKVETVFKALALKFPSAFLEFLKRFSLENCGTEMLEGFESAELDQAVLVALPFRSPKGFWKLYCTHSTAGASTFPKLLTRKPENILQAQRIPFPGICRTKTLEVIINTSSSLKDYSAFSDDTIVHALVMLEWGITGPYFMVRTIMYVVYYLVSYLLSLNLAHVHGESPGNPVYKNGWTIFLSLLLIPMCVYGLCREYIQFESELQLEIQKQSQKNDIQPERKQERWENIFRTVKTWRNAAYNHFDLWNILDFFAFSTQLITDVMILAGNNHVLGPAAISMLLLTWKLYSYARALPTVGTLVRIVTRTMMDMWDFLCFLGCWLLGFAFAFYILLPNIEGFRTVHESMFTVSMMIYGDFDLLKGAEDDAGILAYIIFQLMMLSSVVTMLNLLIARLTDSYQNVKENAFQESIFQLASIIVELKKADRKGLSGDVHARKWVHLLSPVRHQSSEATLSLRDLSAEIKEMKETQIEMREIQKQILERLRSV